MPCLFCLFCVFRGFYCCIQVYTTATARIRHPFGDPILDLEPLQNFFNLALLDFEQSFGPDHKL